MFREVNKKDDTICSISTPLGMGGIGIVRMSGPKAVAIASDLFVHTSGRRLNNTQGYSIRYGNIIDPAAKEVIDEVLVTVMRAPATYTREDVVEINCHSGNVVLRKILILLTCRGARLAEPGEFTRRAFLNGRIDLAQAEAVMSLISARTDTALRAALQHLGGELTEKIGEIRSKIVHLLSEVEAAIDFCEEDLDLIQPGEIIGQINAIVPELDKLIRTAEQGRILIEGISTAIVGKANVGKSSLLNRLLMEERAIVTPFPGTTRDVIEATVNIEGIPLRILDTAGIRDSGDPVEQEGIRRSRESIEKADLVIMVTDVSQRPDAADFRIARLLRGKDTVLVLNKKDLSEKNKEDYWINNNIIEDIRPKFKIKKSLLLDKDVEDVKTGIASVVLEGSGGFSETLIISSVRHSRALTSAKEGLIRAREAARQGLSEELLSVDIRDALMALGEITGETTTEDILDEIFRCFCVGK
jgi:tRNA modification GTPase